MKFLLIVTLIFSADPASGMEKTLVRVHLPRNIWVQGDSITVGSLAIIHSDDDSMTEKISAIAMGRAPFTAESLVIDRRTIMSRLAGRNPILFCSSSTLAQTCALGHN